MSDNYRENVGMVVFNSHGDVLVGERLNFPGSWQFPQGGIDPGESVEDAVERELFEEVGIKNAEIIHKHNDWITYDFPEEVRQSGRFKNFRGQKQKWFLIYWDNTGKTCSLDHHEQEFREVKFIPLHSCLDTVVKFKRNVYETLIREFSPIIKAYTSRIKHG